MSQPRRLGILTAGGDCPGLNAVIRAVTKSALRRKPSIEVVGIQDGYFGLVMGKTRMLMESDVSGILPRGGTILGTSNRDNPFKFISPPHKKPQNRFKDVLATLEREHMDGLIAIGGDGTLSCALEFQKRGIPVIGVPKTIDNDLNGTDVTFGFDSALTVATEAIDRIHTTAEAHQRVMLCEVMGRNAGWIALRSGIAGGGDIILIPEIPYDIEKVCAYIAERTRRGKTFSIVVVAEGAKPKGGATVIQGRSRGADRRVILGGISYHVAKEIERTSGIETRVVVLGHLQRGGTPTAHDRWLATKYGVHAVELAVQGRWGQMVSLRGTQITQVPIADAVRTSRRVDPHGQDVKAAEAVGCSFGR